ncbi:unknown [Bacteroides sp. CAG:1076]|jgi:hypothetical protein|nr:unknown [Bacteroides sp. CAG:1076]
MQLSGAKIAFILLATLYLQQICFRIRSGMFNFVLVSELCKNTLSF